VSGHVTWRGCRTEATGATTITIGVRLNEDDLALHITDDGHAPPGAPADGAGLRGMRERALMIGALLNIEASRPNGLRIELTIPTAHLGG
jgi:two-component system sensor histidine kinase UhpB